MGVALLDGLYFVVVISAVYVCVCAAGWRCGMSKTRSEEIIEQRRKIVAKYDMVRTQQCHCCRGDINKAMYLTGVVCT